MTKLKTKSPISWFGADSSVALDIANLYPEDQVHHMTIPFAGGLSILPHLGFCRGILANDIHQDAIRFYQTIKDETKRYHVAKACAESLSHPAELEQAKRDLELTRAIETYSLYPPDSINIVHAISFWKLSWLGRKGSLGSSGEDKISLSFRRTAEGGANASRIESAAEDIERWGQLFKRLDLTSEDFRKTLEKAHDKPTCAIYCDPPFFEVGKYKHGFTEQDHKDLQSALSRFEHSPIVVRYGDHDFIRDLYAGWDYQDAESRNQSNKMKGEVWFTRNLKS